VPGYLISGTALALATGLPLAWKWQLGVFRACIYLLAASMLAAVALTVADRWVTFNAIAGTIAMWCATVLAAAAGLLIVFFRDPERPVPSRQDVIVSPADGRVVYVCPVEPDQLPLADKKGRTCLLRELAGTTLGDGDATAVGISMNLSDVHVNRAPLGGRVRLIEHVAGTFGSLRNPEMVLTNERVTTVIEDGGLEIAVVQIASRLVRRIVTFISEGDLLDAGQRIGAIRFGSQVDLIIPARQQIRLAVQAGDRVMAGQTIMALITSELSGALTAGSTGRASDSE
jgi:phosphatidylserine decarboxylase